LKHDSKFIVYPLRIKSISGIGAMSGFITESVSKISDGFGSAIKLLAFAALTTLAIIPIRSMFGIYGVIGLLILLLTLSVFYIYSSLKNQMEDKQKAWCGMAAGILLWQVTRYLPEIPGMGWLDNIGIFYWAGLVLITVVLWKGVLSIGGRFLLLTFLLNWIGRLYLVSKDTLVFRSQLVSSIFSYLNLLGIAGILISIWWIVTRSQNSLERKYCGVVLYFSVLLTFLLF
jgi:hypothetical protein